MYTPVVLSIVVTYVAIENVVVTLVCKKTKLTSRVCVRIRVSHEG